MNFRLSLAAILLAATVISGCATNAPKADPFEGVNRASYAFNDTVDKVVLTPLAKGYQAVTPGFFRVGVTNLFTNLGELPTSLNNLLQGKPADAATDAGRFLVNSTLGILGLFDVATPMGLEKHNEDLGQTLGKWGVGSGPFLILPLLGPSSLRDSVTGIEGRFFGYARFIDNVPARNSALALDLVNLRTNLLGASSALDTAALDKYQFVRDAYLQRRLRNVYDGKPPQEKLDQLEDDLIPPAPAKAEKTDKPENK
jgi:phospholipid-binding lipoprotein MlaA